MTPAPAHQYGIPDAPKIYFAPGQRIIFRATRSAFSFGTTGMIVSIASGVLHCRGDDLSIFSCTTHGAYVLPSEQLQLRPGHRVVCLDSDPSRPEVLGVLDEVDGGHASVTLDLPGGPRREWVRRSGLAMVAEDSARQPDQAGVAGRGFTTEAEARRQNDVYTAAEMAAVAEAVKPKPTGRQRIPFKVGQRVMDLALAAFGTHGTEAYIESIGEKTLTLRHAKDPHLLFTADPAKCGIVGLGEDPKSPIRFAKGDLVRVLCTFRNLPPLFGEIVADSDPAYLVKFPGDVAAVAMDGGHLALVGYIETAAVAAAAA